ncbi:MAG: hypothetical protein CMJ96_01190 [Planctomycetes bacterium]|nr:hypothetical protein [Planctomycetota bacterium]MDP7246964.1 hypothetical protein [Planctomycetota bacterium]
MSQSWNYQTRKGGCVACDRSFVEGETLFSLLSMGEESLERGDLCSSCFESHDQANDLYWWRTQHSEKRGGLKLDLDALLALVMRLEEDVRDGALDFRFLVALLLVRHRKLKLASVTKKGKKEFLELRKPRAKKTFPVQVRELEEEQRARLSQILSGLMDPSVGQEPDFGTLT